MNRSRLGSCACAQIRFLLSPGRRWPGRWMLSLLMLAAGLPSAARADAVTDWNNVALQAIRTASDMAPVAARTLAMTHLAIYDAVNAIDQTHRPYFFAAHAPAFTSREAAASQAAYRVLRGLYPAQEPTFRFALNKSLGLVPDGLRKLSGRLLGDRVGRSMLALRAHDGSLIVLPPYVGEDKPGVWRPFPPNFQPAQLPQWPLVIPFAMTSGAQFRQPAPPELSSQAYADAFNEVKALGRRDSAVRTSEQSEIARYWVDGAGTSTPPGHWNRIAQRVAQAQGNTLSQNARLFALLNMGLADAGIAIFDMKYVYALWQPISAIPLASTDINPLTEPDPNWTSFVSTPPAPTYTSGHALFSTTAAVILADFFGTDDIGFTDSSESIVATRSFPSFSAAALETGLSRIYGGVHFHFDVDASNRAGQLLGETIFSNKLQAIR